jgi:hypothetical protein
VRVALAVVLMRVSAPICGAFPLETPVALSNLLVAVRSPLLGSSSREYTNRPTRASQTVLADRVCVSYPNVIVGTDALSRSVVGNGVTVVGVYGLTQNSS